MADTKHKETNPYEDILHLPHHTSTKHPQMSLQDRAAQFAPFAALTGYDATVKETARLTDNKIELSEDELATINLTLKKLKMKQTIVEIIYFKPDSIKTGGMYLSYTGCVKKMDTHEKCLYMIDGFIIAIEDILSIEIIE